MAPERVTLTNGPDFASFLVGGRGIHLLALQGNDGIDASGGGKSIFDLGGGEDSLSRFGGQGDSAYLGTGDDRIELFGIGGTTIVYGQAGWDTVDASFAGARLVFYGGDDRDTALGSSVGDLLFGGYGLDTLFGQRGNDTLRGEGDDDSLDGGDGNDRLYGGDGWDSLLGGRGTDTLFGGFGFDSLKGGTEDSGDGAKDILWGGADGDFFEVNPGGTTDRLADLDFDEGDLVFANGIGEIIRMRDSGDLTTFVGTHGSIRAEIPGLTLGEANAALAEGNIFGLPIFDAVPPSSDGLPEPPTFVPGSPDFMV